MSVRVARHHAGFAAAVAADDCGSCLASLTDKRIRHLGAQSSGSSKATPRRCHNSRCHPEGRLKTSGEWTTARARARVGDMALTMTLVGARVMGMGAAVPVVVPLGVRVAAALAEAEPAAPSASLQAKVCRHFHRFRDLLPPGQRCLVVGAERHP
mmetsp:Transcript_66377/g.142071  ORF Transcript_66377/g.142071 Transcript_66377/m.142071 type:complete len:155 (-) Transcript_66377:96-560(-)